MTERARGLLEAALTLPPEERAFLVEALLESLADDQDELTDEELLAELTRRQSDSTGSVPWNVLKAES